MHKPLLGSILALSLILGQPTLSEAKTSPDGSPKTTTKDPAKGDATAPTGESAALNPEEEKSIRLQIFLDTANFGPGKIDGKGGEFTRKALALYRQAHGLGEKGTGGGSDLAGIDLQSVEPVFTNYTISSEDVKMVGSLAKGPAEQAKQKWLPYQDLTEAMAEKFHCDQDFLKKLNPGKELKEGTEIKVPNVKVFELGEVKTGGKPPADAATEDKGAETQAKNGNDKRADKATASSAGKEPANSASSVSIKIGTKDSMLEVREGEKLVAAFPVTLGSDRTLSPAGQWKVKGVARLPDFRWDEKMLKEGERSDKFHLLPPGPNNPVGVIWISLSKKGIGIHGTSDPDSIGRSESHGCIRLANWDVVKVAGMIKTGVEVTID